MSSRGVLPARQAAVGGRGEQVFARASAVLCWCLVAFLPVYVVLGDPGWTWWQFALAQTGLTVLLVASGSWMWSDAVARKADTERLRRHGRDAVAEVVGVEVTDPGDGSNDVARLELWVSGDDVPGFDAVFRADHDTQLYVVGARFKAVVDVSDNLFTLTPLRR